MEDDLRKIVLFVDCCVRGEENSRTYALCDSFLETLKIQGIQLNVKRICLYKEDIRALNRGNLEHRDSLLKKKDMENPIFNNAHKLAEADYIVVGAPYWDLSFPACLKTYIEQISIQDITFAYTEEGSVGLCKAKKMMYISTVGGILSGIHLGEEYMKQICEFYGIDKFEAYSLQGLDIIGTDVEGKMKAAVEEVKELAARWLE